MGQVGWNGPFGRNVYIARKGVRMCGEKTCTKQRRIGKVGERGPLREGAGGVGENTHELEKTAKMLEKKIQSSSVLSHSHLCIRRQQRILKMAEVGEKYIQYEQSTYSGSKLLNCNSRKQYQER